MRFTMFVLAVTLVAAPTLAQKGYVLNPDGNFVPSFERRAKPAPGLDAPGDLLRTFSVSNRTPLSGYAPRTQGVGSGPGIRAGMWANLSGGNAEIYGYLYHGVLDLTVNVTDVNDSWPGYDGSRSQILCVNAFDDTISGYDQDTGAPAFRVSTPTAGPVGCAWDSTRDVVWYSDWTTNELIGLDCADLQSGVATVVDRFSTAAQLTRIVGVAYNCIDDTLVSGGRDQGMQVAYNAGSHAVVALWPVLGGSVNDPQGCGLTPESGIATTDFQDLNTRVHESTRFASLLVYHVSQITYCVVNFGTPETLAAVGWSNVSDRSVIKGVQTCLGQGARRAATVTLSGIPPSGIFVFQPTGSPVYIQAASLPSKTISNLIAHP